MSAQHIMGWAWISVPLLGIVAWAWVDAGWRVALGLLGFLVAVALGGACVGYGFHLLST